METSRRAIRSPGQRPTGAGLHQQVAQCGALRGPGDDRQAGRLRGELAQQRVLAAATDDVDDGHLASGEFAGAGDRTTVGDGEGVEDAPADGVRVVGQVLTVSAAIARSRPGMSPGGSNRASVMSRTQASPGWDAAAASRGTRSTACPAAFQVRMLSLSTHNPSRSSGSERCRRCRVRW